MTNKEKIPPNGYSHRFFLFTSAFIILSMLVGCGPSPEDLVAVDYTPLPGDDWEVSTPEEQGLDPMLVAELYYNAAELETIYSVLVIKNGTLIAEEYFNEGSIDQESSRQSTTKSYTSALVGIALDQGCLSSVDQKMIEFFPEFEDQISDPRKKQITIRDLLQMRAGYPWEESSRTLFEMLYSGLPPSHLVDIPLTSDPGTEFQYSNLSANLLGIIVSRACGADLKSFGQEHLFSLIDTEVGEWWQDPEDNYFGMTGIHFTAREMAKFGLLYLKDGTYGGNQVIPADWVRDSLQTYSEDASDINAQIYDANGYGYQWWSAREGQHDFNLALGHGGQQIVLLDEFDMVIVVTADPLHAEHGSQPWKYEKANLNLVADFIDSLPSE
jgi:CubicO group peptidase (beta-lactamase class C family)